MVGIYKIINTVTNDCYVGSSIKLRQREVRHFKDLRNGTHHSIILQRAVNKYGIDNFHFLLIEECGIKEVVVREQYWMDLLQPLYNVAKIAGSNVGVKHTLEFSLKKKKYALDNNIRPPESTWKDKQREVFMLDINTLEVLNKFQSLSDACRFVGKDGTYASSISAVATGKRYSNFGYRWVFSLKDISNLRNKKICIAWNRGKKVVGPTKVKPFFNMIYKTIL